MSFMWCEFKLLNLVNKQQMLSDHLVVGQSYVGITLGIRNR